MRLEITADQRVWNIRIFVIFWGITTVTAGKFVLFNLCQRTFEDLQPWRAVLQGKLPHLYAATYSMLYKQHVCGSAVELGKVFAVCYSSVMMF